MNPATTESGLAHLTGYVHEMDGSTLASIAKMADMITTYDTKIDHMEQELKKAKDLRNQIAQVDLPNIVRGSGLSELKLSDGRKVAVKQKISAKVVDMAQLSALLTEKGDSYLLTTTLELGKLSDEVVSKARDMIYQLSGSVPDIKQVIHPMTLKKWVKDEYTAGEEVDVNSLPACLSVYVYYDTTIKG